MCYTNNYEITAEVIKCSNDSFGLVFKNSAGDTVKTFHDVYTNIDDANSFCKLCNGAGLSEAHIYDVLEDALV